MSFGSVLKITRNHRRRSNEGLTKIGNEKESKRPPISPWKSKGTDSFKLSPETNREIDEDLTPLDRDVLALYVGVSSEKITPRKLVPKKVMVEMNKNLDNYSFWNDLDEGEKGDIESLYLDYYLASLLVRAYNNAMIIIFDSPEINKDLKIQYQKERQKLVRKKIYLDTLLLEAIDSRRKQKIRNIAGPRKSAAPEVMSAIRDIVRDLEDMDSDDFSDDEQTSNAHSSIIALLDESTREIIVIGDENES